MPTPKNKEYFVRYFTYYIVFKKGDFWVDQVPFINELDWVLAKQTKFPPNVKKSLMKNGSAEWKDQNGVSHVINIDDHVIPRKWGTNKIKYSIQEGVN